MRGVTAAGVRRRRGRVPDLAVLVGAVVGALEGQTGEERPVILRTRTRRLLGWQREETKPLHEGQGYVDVVIPRPAKAGSVLAARSGLWTMAERGGWRRGRRGLPSTNSGSGRSSNRRWARQNAGDAFGFNLAGRSRERRQRGEGDEMGATAGRPSCLLPPPPPLPHAHDSYLTQAARRASSSVSPSGVVLAALNRQKPGPVHHPVPPNQSLDRVA